MTSGHRTAAAFTAALLTVVIGGCGPAWRGEPFDSSSRLSPAAQAGQVVFMSNCQECHPGGASGLGPAISNKPLPGFLIRYQVRHGLGAMPAFDEEVIDDPELDQLIAYLKELRSI
jgi:mono/diheme cytochrome c family protein